MLKVRLGPLEENKCIILHNIYNNIILESVCVINPHLDRKDYHIIIINKSIGIHQLTRLSIINNHHTESWLVFNLLN